MNDEYLSRLLYKLENSSSERELIDTLNEMAESGREIFLYPVYEAYKKYKNTTIPHYFISVIGAINTTHSLSVLKEIFKDPTTKKFIKMWILPFFEKNNLFEDSAIKFSMEQIFLLRKTGVIEDDYSDEVNLPTILQFLKSAKKMDEILEALKSVLFEQNQRRAIKKILLFYWLRENANDKYQYLIDNYDLIRNDELDIVLAEEIIRWKGKKVETLIKLIIEKGYERAKEIIYRSLKEKQGSNTQKKENQYPNIDLVKEIISLKTKINFNSQANTKLGLTIFKDTEALITQQESVNSLESLFSKCISLRDIIQCIEPKAISHEMELEQAKKYLPGITKETLHKGLNALQLTLISRGLLIPKDFFGFKRLNRATSLIAAHPKEQKDLILILTELGLLKVYKDSNWQEIHTSLLKQYKMSLELLLKSVS